MLQSLTSRKIAKYFPLINGKYEVKPSLFSLHHDFGNKIQDTLIFQIDQQFSQYRNNKLKARDEDLKKYFCTDNFSDSHQQYITQYLINRICHEYPDFFTFQKLNNQQLLTCKLTNEKLLLTNNYELIKSEPTNYSNSFDAVMMQVQEDIAIITEDDHITCLHLMAPNFWSASDKIGKSFNEIHQHVAGIETIAKSSKSIINAMIYKGPYVRFAWGITTDNVLNHYPEQISNDSLNSESGREFNPKHPKLYCRVERQTINGLPDINSALFTIRSYLYDIDELSTLEIKCIINAINSMTKKQLEYKGLNVSKSAIIKWLTTLL